MEKKVFVTFLALSRKSMGGVEFKLLPEKKRKKNAQKKFFIQKPTPTQPRSNIGLRKGEREKK